MTYTTYSQVFPKLRDVIKMNVYKDKQKQMTNQMEPMLTTS